MAIVSADKLKLIKGERVSEVLLYSVDELIKNKAIVAFDHMRMIEFVIERIKNKVDYTKIAFEFVGLVAFRKRFNIELLECGSDSIEVIWVKIGNLNKYELAFDHREMIEMAINKELSH